MKSLVLIFFAMATTSIFAIGPNFPIGPNSQLTPGKVCDMPTAYRYPEHIAYCERDVTYETKEILIKQYDQQFGFSIGSMPRGDFKVDHFIPLCAGGSNDIRNLWPQHKSVYAITDPLEPLICKKMSLGKLRQSDAIMLIIRAKTNLNQVNDIMRILNTL